MKLSERETIHAGEKGTKVSCICFKLFTPLKIRSLGAEPAQNVRNCSLEFVYL